MKVICPYNKEIIKINEYIRKISNNDQVSFITYGDKTFKVGEHVMMTINDYSNNIFNGDEGTVSSVNNDDSSDEVLTVRFHHLGEKDIIFYNSPKRKYIDPDEEEYFQENTKGVKEEQRASVDELEYS